MAYAVQLTIGTGNKVSINYQSQDVSVSLTYQLEREDADVLAVAREKAGEVAAAHRIAWEHIRDEKVSQNKVRGKGVRESEQSGATSEEAFLQVEPLPSEVPLEEEVALETKEENGAPSVPLVPLTSGQAAAIQALVTQAGWSAVQMQGYLREHFQVHEVSELSTTQAAQMLLYLQREERLKTQSRSQERRTTTARLNGHS